MEERSGGAPRVSGSSSSSRKSCSYSSRLVGFASCGRAGLESGSSSSSPSTVESLCEPSGGASMSSSSSEAGCWLMPARRLRSSSSCFCLVLRALLGKFARVRPIRLPTCGQYEHNYCPVDVSLLFFDSTLSLALDSVSSRATEDERFFLNNLLPRLGVTGSASLRSSPSSLSALRPSLGFLAEVPSSCMRLSPLSLSLTASGFLENVAPRLAWLPGATGPSSSSEGNDNEGLDWESGDLGVSTSKPRCQLVFPMNQGYQNQPWSCFASI